MKIMKQFIEKSNIKFDNIKIKEVYDSLPPDILKRDQISITKRFDEDSYDDGEGGLHLNKTNYDEFPSDFDWNKLNSFFNETYIEYVLKKLDNLGYRIGRSRFMKMPPRKAYSYHCDFTNRIHIPIYTNKLCFFVDENLKQFWMDEEGIVYFANTTKYHSAINISNENRLHLVLAYERKY